ncbi:DNA primase [Campylobacter rectus RM3267]|uniref:DNA primase n=2 Tax=Campylobacter rectus TaxID=203 RepID=A0A6G5QPV6_CAMRE|nr:DNA primase [Campylobacter rectus]EEF12669.1 DNA primase [Campylobacter rectus RM3267]QCD47793.1 DNA primase [Campylobacter rectus]UEB48487.1 DNA primase [Campylobacter rectus]
MIDPKSIERLKAQTDIVDVVGHYLPLKKSGANFVCVCPFHDDKNPSMSVSPSRGIFHCFSCKAGGDAIKFVMDYEKLSYPEAVEKIAGLQNFTLNYVRGGEPAKENKHILENANAFYRSLLYKTPAAVEYLYSRGITDELIDKFELGFAPESAQTIRLLQNEQIEPKEALEVGIVKQNENGIYASFINRITFPIYTHAGRLVGFGGRTISGNPAKYVNSPQSAVFDKSTLFYGYHLAKREIFTKNQIIITEGYMDVIMLHKAGFNNVVAVLGTALTTKHLPLLKRGEISVILCFDGDDAGINAATKSALLLAQNEIDGSVVIIEGGADPADMVVAGKIEYLRQIFESGTEIGEFYIRHLASGFDLSRPVQKQKALEAIQAFTASLKPIVANSYAPLVAKILKIAEGSFWLTRGANTQAAQERMQAYEMQNFGKNQRGRKDILEIRFLKTMLENPNLKKIVLENLKTEYFVRHRDIFEAVARGVGTDDPAVRELMFENYDAFKEEDEILKNIVILKVGFYENLHKEYSMKQIPLEEKKQILTKIKKIIEALKK